MEGGKEGRKKGVKSCKLGNNNQLREGVNEGTEEGKVKEKVKE